MSSLCEDSTTDWMILHSHPEHYSNTKSERFGFPRFLNGMDAACQLRQIDKDTVLIFITNLAQYAINSYDVHALDFMVKPVECGECLPFAETVGGQWWN